MNMKWRAVTETASSGFLREKIRDLVRRNGDVYADDVIVDALK